MAEAASAAATATATATAPRRTYDATRGSPSHSPLNALRSQKSTDTRPNASTNANAQQPRSSTSRSGWRVPTDQAVARRPSPPTTPSKDAVATIATAGSGTSSSSRYPATSTPRRPTGPGLGPVITPTRQTSSPSASGSSSAGTVRRASYVNLVLLF